MVANLAGIYLVVVTARILSSAANARIGIAYRSAVNADPGVGAGPGVPQTHLFGTTTADTYYISHSYIQDFQALNNFILLVYQDGGVTKSFDDFSLRVVRLGTF